MPAGALIVGVDLVPIKPIPRTITFAEDINSYKCRDQLRQILKDWKADIVIHDGAPNVGTAWVQDAYAQSELTLQSLRLAVEFLTAGGTFVTKVFRSKDYNALLWCFQQLFMKVEATKPPSSRNVSAEIFVVCRGYKAPKNLDPRFLDANYAFAEVKEKAPNMEAKVFNPEKKKRKRDGYEEGDWTQFHEVSVTEFIESEDPIQLLGSLNRLHFREENNKDDVLKIVDSLPETTEEVKLCTQDLKVLGRKEFKMLLRWRLKARRVMGLSVKKAPLASDASSKVTTAVGATDDAVAEGAEGVTVESMDDELRLQQEIKQMKEMADKTKRKERRRENERKQKEITRLQMHMITPTDIGIEAADNGDNTFKLRDVDKSGIARELSRARMHTTVEPDKHHETEFDEEDEEDEDGDRLEAELDQMYQQYTEKREDRSAKVKAKRARMKARGGSDDEFEGFGSDNNDEGSDSDDGLRMEDDDDASSDEEEDENGDKLMTDLQSKPAPRKDGLTNRAANFFEQDIFKDIGGVDDDVEEDDEDEEKGSDDESNSEAGEDSDDESIAEHVPHPDDEPSDDSDAEEKEDAEEETKKSNKCRHGYADDRTCVLRKAGIQA